MGREVRQRVVIVGGGFAGLNAARALRHAPVDVTLVDRRNHHLFQPLLYQVATGALAPGEIAYPLRSIVKRQPRVTVLLGEVDRIDLDARRIRSTSPLPDVGSRELAYDTLIVATGSRHSYFGHDEWEHLAPGLKSIEDAVTLRSRILGAFEAAEVEADPERRRAWLTFAVVGAGPTGVEMAGQIAEIARDTLARDFRSANPADARIVLLDAGDRVLPAFSERLQRHATQSLHELGVETRTGTAVTAVDADGVTVAVGGDRTERLRARTVVWAAGVTASSAARLLADAAGVPTDAAGRVPVRADLTLEGHPEVFAVGDMALVLDGRGRPLPGIAPVAMQEGTYAGRTTRRRALGQPPEGPFRYVDKGTLATIGRAKAIADIKGLELWGLPAWLLWLLVHITYLIGFQNRLLVLLRWAFSFVTRGRGSRIIAADPPASPP